MRMISQPAHWERTWSLTCNRLNRRPVISALFGLVSRLGNGVFWYALMVFLPLIYGTGALFLVVMMLSCGILSVILYSLLKRGTHKPRPSAVSGIFRTVEPLDAFSFPSGHTMHAVGFTWLVVHQHPELGWVLIPFTVLIAASRLILGLHYPFDVVVGAVIGAAVAGLHIGVFLP